MWLFQEMVNKPPIVKWLWEMISTESLVLIKVSWERICRDQHYLMNTSEALLLLIRKEIEQFDGEKKELLRFISVCCSLSLPSSHLKAANLVPPFLDSSSRSWFSWKSADPSGTSRMSNNQIQIFIRITLEARFMLWVSSCFWLVFSFTPGILSFPRSAGSETCNWMCLFCHYICLFELCIMLCVFFLWFTAPSKSNNEVIVSLS